MARDLIFGSSSRDWSRGSNSSTLGLDDPLFWTPNAVRAELDRIRNFVDVVNMEMSAAVEQKKVSQSEWKAWFATYQAAHRITDKGSGLWGSNVIAARKHEEAAVLWRDLLKSRGAIQIGPGTLKKDKPWIDTPTAILLVGGVIGGGYLLKHLAGFTGLFKGKALGAAPSPTGTPSWHTTSSSRPARATGRAI